MTAVIFGGADINNYSLVSVPEDGYIIAADKGYMHCRMLGIAPDAVIGDFDSCSCPSPEGDWVSFDPGAYPEAYKRKKAVLDGKETEIISAPSEKDDTDMHMAVRYAVQSGFDDIIVYGGLGGRAGHSMANIQTMTYAVRTGCNILFAGDTCSMTVLRKGMTYRCSDEKNEFAYISVFSLSEQSEADISGLKYSGSNIRFSCSFPLGVSNEFQGNIPGCITVNEGELLIILERK
ncbi:MAG: thiamine diphosphokinase [Huintestinicola sp.]